jgi:hypothetical protein
MPSMPRRYKQELTSIRVSVYESGNCNQYKYADLALQIGEVSNETVKYSLELCKTSTSLDNTVIFH